MKETLYDKDYTIIHLYQVLGLQISEHSEKKKT